MSRWPIFAVAGVILAGIFINTHGEVIEEPPQNAREACDSLADRSLCQAASFISQRKAGIAPIAPVAETLPNARLTPGAINPDITQANIDTTICNPGFAASVMPSSAWLSSAARRLAQRDHPGQLASNFHIDHLVPISLGGAPADPRNLWLQPWTGHENAAKKDQLEQVVHAMVCARQVTLASAQQAIARNWIDLLRRVTSPGMVAQLQQKAMPQAMMQLQPQPPVTLQAENVEPMTPQTPTDDLQIPPNQPAYEVPAIVPEQF